jgi:hypothetical protein
MSYDTVFLAGEQLVSWDRARLDRHASVILLSTRGLERHGRELLNAYVRDGGGLLLATGSGVDGEVAADLIDRALSITVIDAKGAPGASSSRSLAPADPRHPVFAAFGAGAASLGLVRFQRISTLRGERCAVLARFTTGETGLAECAVGSGRVLVLASDLGKSWNDFPLHATFVPFLQEAVRYLAGDRRRAAEYLVGSVPAGVAARPGVTMRPDPEHGGESRLVAVNVDPAESDPDRLTPEEFQGAVQRLQDAARSAARLQARQEEDRQRIWQYLLGVMLAVMAVESAIARRSV